MRRFLALSTFFASVCTIAVLLLSSTATAHQSRSASGLSCSTDSAGNVTCADKKYKCTTAVDVPSLTVSMPNNSDDGVALDAGCSGHFGLIDITQWHGDGLKIGSAQNVTIDRLVIHCYAHDPAKHQDGVQAMGGLHIYINAGYIGCYSANDSQVTLHDGAGGNGAPTDVLISNVTIDPAGAQDPTGQPPYHYGAGGAYGISNAGVSSGYVNDTLISLANLHDVYTSVDAVNPVWVGNTYPPGVRCNNPVVEGC